MSHRVDHHLRSKNSDFHWTSNQNHVFARENNAIMKINLRAIRWNPHSMTSYYVMIIMTSSIAIWIIVIGYMKEWRLKLYT